MSRSATTSHGRQTSKAVNEWGEEQMEESYETPRKKIATDKKKKGNSGTKTTKSAVSKPPTVKKRKASKVVESNVEENKKDSEAKYNDGGPQTARRSVAFRSGESDDHGLPDVGKYSDPIYQPMSVQEESKPSVDLQSSHPTAEQILDEIGVEIEIEKSKAATPTIQMEYRIQAKQQRPSRLALKTSKTQSLPLERSQNHLIDAVFDNVTKTFGPPKLLSPIPSKPSFKIPKTTMIDGYPPAPGTGQNKLPSVGEYSRHGSGEKVCKASPGGIVAPQRSMTNVEKKELDASKAALQEVYSEISGTLMPAVGSSRYDKAFYENAVQTGQWEKLKNIVVDKRIGLENQVTELKIEVSEWKEKYQQLQQKVTDSADIFKRGLDKHSESMDIFKRGLDNMVAADQPIEPPRRSILPAPVSNSDESKFQSRPTADQPNGSRRSILPAPVSNNDESKLQPRPTEPSYPPLRSILSAPASNSDEPKYQSRSTVPSYSPARPTSCQPYPINRGGYTSRRPAQFVQRFNRGRPFNRGGFNGRGGQVSQRRSFNDGPGYGVNEGEPRRSQTNYADLDAAEGEYNESSYE